MANLNELLAGLDPQAPLAQRHLWLIALLDWVRGPRGSPPQAAASRMCLFLDALAAQPGLEDQLRQWWRVLGDTVDAAAMLADFGYAARVAFISEFNERLRQKFLPATPETTGAATLVPAAAPQLPPSNVVSILAPGAARSTHGPKLENAARWPVSSMAATASTSG